MRLPLNVFVAGTIAIGSLSPRDGSIERAALGATATADTVREYRGLYEAGFEMSWFHPCDAPAGDDTWWVTLTDVALRQRDSLAAKLRGTPGGAVFVRWRGTTSMKMQAGHMGRGSRYMLVHEVLELKPATEAGCTST
jgi:hypothetical protein